MYARAVMYGLSHTSAISAHASTCLVSDGPQLNCKIYIGVSSASAASPSVLRARTPAAPSGGKPVGSNCGSFWTKRSEGLTRLAFSLTNHKLSPIVKMRLSSLRTFPSHAHPSLGMPPRA